MRRAQQGDIMSLPWQIAFLIRRFSFGGESIQTVKMDYAIYKKPHSHLNLPPIMIMHGLNVSRSNWRRTGRFIAKRGPRAVIAVDARNHGESGHSSEHTPKHMAADAAAFIVGHKLNRIVALGHSMGGRALMTLALTQPEQVECAIFVDITPGKLPRDVQEAWNLFEKMVEVLPTIPNELPLHEGRKFILPSFVKLVKSDLDLILIAHNLKKTESGTFAWKSNPQAILDGWEQSMCNYEKTLSGLKPYDGKTLLIAAKKTTFVTPSNIKTMKKYFPNLRVEYLDADHKVHVSQPDKFLNLVVDFTKP
ncbi:protein ABHD11 [Drosophila innubila]|uniref:protein ABHD11 n=1 Tax=Drosophila innubila TaxID=198719 RepID=UPI00148BE70A|nr:protein ABHD11 [Drosophila innubila]